MSYTEIMAVRKSGRVEGVEELRNSHLFGPIVWSTLYEKYFRPWNFRLESDEYDAAKARGEDVGEFDYSGHRRSWKLYEDPRTEEHDWAVLAATFDNVVLPGEHLPRFADLAERYHREHPEVPGGRMASHFGRIAEVARELHRLGSIGMCFYGCSIVENPWSVRHPSRPRWRAYNVNRDSKHWIFDPADYPGRGAAPAAGGAS